MLDNPMDMTVSIKLLSEMKFWLAWVMEETNIAELFNDGNL
jgi:hypothetical protein